MSKPGVGTQQTDQDNPPVIYTCARCGKREVGDSAFEAGKPVGFYLDLRKVTGETFRHHQRTPATVFFCTKECLLEGIQYGISAMVKPTTPIGMDARRSSPPRGR